MKMQPLNIIWKKVVGERRFELPTSWSRTKRATRLRYSPDKKNIMRRVPTCCKQVRQANRLA